MKHFEIGMTNLVRYDWDNSHEIINYKKCYIF